MRLFTIVFFLVLLPNSLRASAHSSMEEGFATADKALHDAKEASALVRTKLWKVLGIALTYKDHGTEAAQRAVALVREILAIHKEQESSLNGLAQMALNQIERVADFESRNLARAQVDQESAKTLAEYHEVVTKIIKDDLSLRDHADYIEETESQLKVAIDIYLTRAVKHQELAKTHGETDQEELRARSLSLLRMYAEMAEECLTLILTLQEYKGRRHTQGSRIWICPRLTERQRQIEALLRIKAEPLPSAMPAFEDDATDAVQGSTSQDFTNLTLNSEEDDQYDEDGGDESSEGGEANLARLLSASRKSSDLHLLLLPEAAPSGHQNSDG